MTIRSTLIQWNRKYLLVAKLLFFSMNLAFCACHTFRAKYLEQTQGISSKSYGLIAAVLSLLVFFGGMFWSYIADRTGRYKMVLLICVMASASVFQIFIIKIPEEIKLPMVTVVSGLYIFFLSGMPPLLDALIMHMLTSTPGFNPTHYGRQRMFGTIAYGTISVTISYAPTLFPIVNIFVITLSAACLLVILYFVPSTIYSKETGDEESANAKTTVITHQSLTKACPNQPISSPPIAVVAKKMGYDMFESERSSKPRDTTKRHSKHQSQSKSPFYTLMTDPNFLFLLFIVFMNGLARATMTHFLEPIQRLVFKTPQEVSGWSIMTGVSFEMIIFFFSKDLLVRLGPRNMLLLSQLFMVARICCYAFLPRNFFEAKYMPLVYELLKGISSGFMQSGAVIMVTELSPPSLKSTAQSIYYGIFNGISAFTAGVIGYMIQNMEAKYTIREGMSEEEKLLSQEEVIERSSFLLAVTAYISIFALAIFFVKYIVIDGYPKRKK